MHDSSKRQNLSARNTQPPLAAVKVERSEASNTLTAAETMEARARFGCTPLHADPGPERIALDFIRILVTNRPPFAMNAMDSAYTQSETIVTGLIQDRQGRAFSYSLTILEESRNWAIFDGECRIGYAWCGCYGSEFRIGDLRFEQAFRQPRRGWRRYLFREAPPINYRQRGLGSALLPLLIAHARESGCKRVTGMLSAVDLVPFPALTEWYARFGFRSTLSPGPGPQMGMIELTL